MRDLSSDILSQIKSGNGLYSYYMIEFLEYEIDLEGKIRNILSDDFHIPESLRLNIIEMVKYNAVGGKMIRGLFSVYSTYVLCETWDTAMKEQY